MQKILWIFMVAVLWAACHQPAHQAVEEAGKDTEYVVDYDSVMAVQLNADSYGMHQYVMAFLKTGDNRPTDSLERMNLQRAHLDNINKLADAGKLVLAGPFIDNGELRGIYLFDVKTIEEARKLTETDPAIQYGSLKMELHLWYGSAALLKVNEIHNRIAKEKP